MRLSLVLALAMPSFAAAQPTCVPEVVSLSVTMPTGRCATSLATPSGGPGVYSAPHAPQIAPTTAGTSRPAERAPRRIWLAGIVLVASAYLADVVPTLTLFEPDYDYYSDLGVHDEFRWFSFVPIAGPWIQLVTGYLTGATEQILLALDGVSQLGGLALFIAGVMLREEVPVAVAFSPSDGGGVLALSSAF